MNPITDPQDHHDNEPADVARTLDLRQRRRLPRVYLLLVVLTATQLVLFELTGTLSQVSMTGAAVMVVLLAALARRSRIVWGFLILMNALQLLATVPALFGVVGHVEWAHIIAMLTTGIALAATLLSPAMRQFVGLDGHSAIAST